VRVLAVTVVVKVVVEVKRASQVSATASAVPGLADHVHRGGGRVARRVVQRIARPPIAGRRRLVGAQAVKGRQSGPALGATANTDSSSNNAAAAAATRGVYHRTELGSHATGKWLQRWLAEPRVRRHARTIAGAASVAVVPVGVVPDQEGRCPQRLERRVRRRLATSTVAAEAIAAAIAAATTTPESPTIAKGAANAAADAQATAATAAHRHPRLTKHSRRGRRRGSGEFAPKVAAPVASFPIDRGASSASRPFIGTAPALPMLPLLSALGLVLVPELLLPQRQLLQLGISLPSPLPPCLAPCRRSTIVVAAGVALLSACLQRG